MQWLLEHPDLQSVPKSGNVLLGTVDSWLLWNLTRGAVHATDVTNASRTMLMNLNTLQWDSELLDLFGISEQMQPEIKDSDACFGFTDSVLFGRSILVFGVLGDQQAALYGQGC